MLADIARKIAPEAATWRYSVTDNHGQLRHHGTIQARPVPGTAAHEYAFVKARDRRCRLMWRIGPTCRTPAHRADIDHTRQRRHGGASTRYNLTVECRHHHLAKDQGGFGLEHLPHGALQWTTPLGHTYTVTPDGPF